MESGKSQSAYRLWPVCRMKITNCTWRGSRQKFRLVLKDIVCVHVWEWATHQLQGREVTFPPQVLLHVRSDGSQGVVRVHDDVNEAVAHPVEERCRRWWKQKEAQKQIKKCIRKHHHQIMKWVQIMRTSLKYGYKTVSTSTSSLKQRN